ncbi:HSP90 family protein [Austwickia sp. TVS 96-490-7B]|uniref:HSP90 family protein n=1 Tax=Austwickia sp. TVS 96-490-7B TaxID=2830843 RepID=UPI001C59D36C|nr:HSP90 family protein [Austwickia sp. TVS 96-490-7B]
MTAQFHVDLRGIVDLLSHHLYSSPRVYLRELIQNGVDAIEARRRLPGRGGASTGRIVITPADVAEDGCLHITDDGVGLTPDDIEQCLATIGASSKRTTDGMRREGFMGQFGIGLLSCFLVADTIELTTRHVDGGPTWRWRGESTGVYHVDEADIPQDQPGSTVRLQPRPSAAHLLRTAEVTLLVSQFAAFLPIDIVVNTADGPEHLAERRFPWEKAVDGASLPSVARRASGVDLCQELFGFVPLHAVEIADVQTGVRGMAYVMPFAGGQRGTHRVYARHMLVSDSCPEILPDWAVFVRAVLDTENVRLTAGRESLYADATLAGVRERLGAQILGWLTRTAQTDPARIRSFLDVHEVTLKRLATQDDDLLSAVVPWLAFESTLGPVSLPEFAHGQPVIRYAASVEDFRQLAPFAAAQGTSVVNAGYAFEGALLRRFAEVNGVDTQALTPAAVMADLTAPDADEEASYLPLLDLAQRALDRSGCEVVVRSFEPASMPAVVLAGRATRAAARRRETLDESDGVWADLLRGLGEGERRPQFVLNIANPSIQALRDRQDDEVCTTAVEALYAHALVSGHHRLRPFDTALMARALPCLIDRALRVQE